MAYLPVSVILFLILLSTASAISLKHHQTAQTPQLQPNVGGKLQAIPKENPQPDVKADIKVDLKEKPIAGEKEEPIEGLGNQQGQFQDQVPSDEPIQSGPSSYPIAQIYYADSQQPWNLKTDNQWNQFPDLNIAIDLEFGQFVDIQYRISGRFEDQSYFIATVMINGVEEPKFRCISGDSTYFTVSGTSKQFLESGVSVITVEYRTPKPLKTPKVKDWSHAYLQVYRQ